MTPEDEQQRQEWAKRDADESETLPIKELLEKIHYESITGDPQTVVPLTRTTARVASLLYRLSIEGEKQTAKVVRLTRWLKWLTVGLLFLTAALTVYAYLQSQRDSETDHRRTHQHLEDRTVPY
jgi:hypothetical protein